MRTATPSVGVILPSCGVYVPPRRPCVPIHGTSSRICSGSTTSTFVSPMLFCSTAAAYQHPPPTGSADGLQPARDLVRDPASAAGDPLRARPQLLRDRFHHLTGGLDAGRRRDPRRSARHPMRRAASCFCLRYRPRNLHVLAHPPACRVLGLCRKRLAHAFDLPRAASPRGAHPALAS